MRIGECIKNARKTNGKTQIELAKSAGIAVNSLRLYEANKREPSLKQLSKIAQALGLELNCSFEKTCE